LNRGSAGVKIIVLGLIILIAAVPWYFIISRNLDSFLSGEPIHVQATPDGDPESWPPSDEIPPELPPSPTPQPTPDVTLDPDYDLDMLGERVIDIKEIKPDLFRELNESASDHNAIAVSLVLFDSETDEYFTYEYGYADVEENRQVDIDTKFRAASLAKLTTVICAMVLVDRNMIDLDTDISIYLGYDVKNTNFPGAVITMRMLMQHTSSVFDSGAFQLSRDRNSSESVRFLLERGSSFRRNQPGTNFEYTNFGYSIIGAICENVYGKSLDTLAREILFEPLDIDAAYVPSKMNDTENLAVLYNDRHAVTRSVMDQLDIEESEILGHDLHLAQGNLTISMIDYARILAMLGNNGILNGVRILSSESVRAIHRADVEGAAYEQGLATRYSVGSFMPGEGFYWHTGSAYGVYAQYLYSIAHGSSRGVVVVTTGATTDRETNGMVGVCTELSTIVWREIFLESEENDEDLDEGVDED